MVEKLRNSYAVGIMCSDKKGECFIFPKFPINSPEFLELITEINKLNDTSDSTWSVTQYGHFSDDFSLFIDEYDLKYFDFKDFKYFDYDEVYKID